MPEKSKNRSGRRHLPKDELEDLVEEATIDAYGEEEQVTSFFTVLDEHLTLPFDTVVLGVDVTVEKLDLTDRSDDIVIVCRRRRSRQAADPGSAAARSATQGLEVDRGISVLGARLTRWLRRSGGHGVETGLLHPVAPQLESHFSPPLPGRRLRYR